MNEVILYYIDPWASFVCSFKQKEALTARSIVIAVIVNFDPRTFPLAFWNGDGNKVGSCYCSQRLIMKNTSAIHVQL